MSRTMTTAVSSKITAAPMGPMRQRRRRRRRRRWPTRRPHSNRLRDLADQMRRWWWRPRQRQTWRPKWGSGSRTGRRVPRPWPWWLRCPRLPARLVCTASEPTTPHHTAPHRTDRVNAVRRLRRRRVAPRGQKAADLHGDLGHSALVRARCRPLVSPSGDGGSERRRAQRDLLHNPPEHERQQGERHRHQEHRCSEWLKASRIGARTAGGRLVDGVGVDDDARSLQDLAQRRGWHVRLGQLGRRAGC